MGACAGLVHCDFNEFNLLVNDDEARGVRCPVHAAADSVVRR